MVPSCLPRYSARCLPLAGVFDDLQSMLLGDRHNPVHIAGLAHDMDGHDRLGVFSNSPFHIVGVDLEKLRIQVRQHRQRPGTQNCGDSSGIGIRRGDDLVSRADSQGFDARVQCLRPRTGGHAIGHSRRLRELVFERGDRAGLGLDSAPDPAPGGLHDRIHHILIPGRPRGPTLALPERIATEDCELGSIVGGTSAGCDPRHGDREPGGCDRQELPSTQNVLILRTPSFCKGNC